MSLCSPIVLRRLDYNEMGSIKSNDLSNFTKLIRIESKIDYFQHIDLIKEAITKWVNIHPFLSSKIQNLNLNYFIYDKSIDLFKDVNFYCVNNATNDEYDELIHLLLENETFNKLKHNEILWRLMLIKLNKDTINNETYEYDFIFTIHHSITEGRNAYFILLQLIDIFEAFFQKLSTYDVIKPMHILPSMENLFLRNTTKILSSTSFVSGFRKPSFVNLTQAYDSRNKFTKLTNVKICSLDNKENLSISNLINNSLQNESKFKFITFDSADLNRLILKLKNNKIKMQAFLNVLFSFAIQKLYKEKGSEYDHDHSVIYGYAVNLRKFSLNPTMFGASNLNENMGFSSNVFVNSFRQDVDFSQDYADLFWSCVQKENNEMLNRFEIDEHFKIPNVLGSYGELRFDLILSNVGIMEKSYATNSLHKVKSCYFTGVNEYANKIAFCYFITVNDKLCWSFLYNSFVISDQIADFIVNTVKEIFYNLFD